MGIRQSAWVVLSLNGRGPWGRLGPGGVQGQCPAGVFRVAKPPGRKRIWVFWRPVCSPSVHRNCENHSFVCALKLKHQNQHFSTFSVTPSNFFKTTNIKSDSQDHKIYRFPLALFKIYACMSHDLPDYQS